MRFHAKLKQGGFNKGAERVASHADVPLEMFRHFIPDDTYIHTCIHILYLNTIGFKAQSLWSRVKIITIKKYIKYRDKITDNI